jgi:hypothetical protein
MIALMVMHVTARPVTVTMLTRLAVVRENGDGGAPAE